MPFEVNVIAGKNYRDIIVTIASTTTTNYVRFLALGLVDLGCYEITEQ